MVMDYGFIKQVDVNVVETSDINFDGNIEV